MKRLLALDLGTKTGWAFRGRDGSVSVGSALFLKMSNPGDRWLRFNGWLAEREADAVIYETPFIHPKHRSGWGVAYGFTAILQLYTATRMIPCEGIAPRALKEWVTGNGNASKLSMLRFARNSGWDLADDDEIDARWLLEFAVKRIWRNNV